MWLGGCLVFALVAAGCEDDSERANGTEPAGTAATATPNSSACPVEQAACDFAQKVAAAITAADVVQLNALSAPEQFECLGPVAGGLGGPYPLCDGSVAGEVREGFWVHVFNSDGGTVQESILPALRDAVLGSGPGVGGKSSLPPHIIGIHCPVSAGSAACRDEFVVYFDGAPNVGVRAVGERLRIGWLQFGNFAEDPSVWRTGGDLAYAHTDLLPGRFWPWRPAPTREALDIVKERWLFAPPPVADLRAEPSEGACPAEVTLRLVPAPGPFKPGKEPVPVARIFPGIVGGGQAATSRSGYVEVPPTGNPADGTLNLAIPPSACQGDILTIVLAGDRWRVAGYRVR